MSRVIKITIICVFAIVLMITIGIYVASKTLKETFKADCQECENWSIAEYKIQRYKCLGFSGPYYYSVVLFKDKEKVAEGDHISDSCFIKFRPKNNLYLKFNVCSKSFKEIRANKKELDAEKVSSVCIKDLRMGSVKTLKNKAIKKFVFDWNRSKISDHREQNPIFYPGNRFEISVFLEDNEVKFYASSHLIADESNWVYYISKSDTTYFDKLMSERY